MLKSLYGLMGRKIGAMGAGRPGMAGSLLRGYGRSLDRIAASPIARRTAFGAAVGLNYGVVSGDETMLGGALKGAAIGAGVHGGMALRRSYRGFRRGVGPSGPIRPMAAGAALSAAVSDLSRRSYRHISGGINSKYCTIKGLFTK